MYKEHKVVLIVLFLVIFVCSLRWKINYAKIADDAITVVSIVLAVYIAVASALLGTPYAEKLKSKDDYIPDKTKLGVLAAYLRIAGCLSVIILLISSLYVLELDVFSENLTFRFEWVQNIIENSHILISAISCALFFANILFMGLILKFLINSLTKSV